MLHDKGAMDTIMHKSKYRWADVSLIIKTRVKGGQCCNSLHHDGLYIEGDV